ncbi:glycerol-3-phosphate dehydrogenase [Rhodococcus sp. 27YEA15]|uniref:glycerol-3-phosphate dehydrogenase/oxidase n=1 Tax=Rhodococcus sp. 27YEA15 TaxID=3156259 RepID=UPI003C7996F0
MSGALSSLAREHSLERMGREPFDILVVGGGVVGAGAALDAATRGLSTALVEARDWASGTSSRSSKLIHGGLRYLEMLDFGLVHEALRERGLLLNRLAPHLVRPVPFLYPLTRPAWERVYVGAGIAMYDALALASRAKKGIPTHRHLSRRAALDVAPALRPDALRGAIQYFDAAVDDARHTMSIVRTAAEYGACVANRVEVTKFVRDGDRVVGAELHDLESGRRSTVHARQIINATGAWSTASQQLAGSARALTVRASKGVHLVLPADRIDSASGIIARSDHSVLFVIPWGQHWIVGTTDTEWDDPTVEPVTDADDVDYLLEQVNRILRRPVGRADVVGTYAGLRPLVAGSADSTTKLSREHVVSAPLPGLLVIAGGKYTTYRVMAADVVNEAVREFGPEIPPSCTQDVPLVGGAGFAALWNKRSRLAVELGLTTEAVERLLRRYGDRISDLGALLHDRPELAFPVLGAPGYLRAEIVYAVTHEDARHLDDILIRRTRIAMEYPGHGIDAAAEVADLIAPLLNWDAATVAEELASYHDLASAESTSLEGVMLTEVP